MENKKELENINGNLNNNIFTIGDRTTKGIIQKFEINNSNCLVVTGINYHGHPFMCNLLDDTLQKVKDKMFTTEDGIDIYPGDKTYGIHTGTFKPTSHDNEPWGTGTPLSHHKHFSTKEAREKYIIENKPLLSFKDVTALYVASRGTTKGFAQKVLDKVMEKIKIE